jgi:hypothetical protein
MNAKQTHPPANDEMPAEIDFSKGVRGKFYRAGARMVLPVHLDEHREAARQETTAKPRP